jgi:hypothetical protein
MALEVISTVEQLKTAYRKHYKYSKVDKQDISHCLLLVYAVECGLKAQYLQDHNGKTTQDFTSLPVGRKYSNDHKYGHGHSILDWVRELKIPANIIDTFKDDDKRPLKQLHERLRYGVFSPNGEKAQIDLLTKIAEALKIP